MAGKETVLSAVPRKRDRRDKMHANLIAHIRRISLSFIMKLVHVLPALEKRTRKAGLPNSNGVPNKAPLYVLGSSAAADIAKTEEQSIFPNIYPGTLPSDDSWGTFTDGIGDIYANDPLTASKPLMESYWELYQNPEPDPDPNWEPSNDMLG
jgi:hypothetical protein